MANPRTHIVALILVAGLVAACAPEPTPTPPAPGAGSPVPTGPSAGAAPAAAPPTETSPQRRDGVKIRLRVNEREMTATLVDNRATQDFLSLLPLTLTLDDYAQAEKISSLPRRLSAEGSPAGVDPSAGDITYYAPWGNLAIFYRDSGYANGLVLLGRLDGATEALDVPGSVGVTIERTE